MVCRLIAAALSVVRRLCCAQRLMLLIAGCFHLSLFYSRSRLGARPCQSFSSLAPLASALFDLRLGLHGLVLAYRSISCPWLFYQLHPSIPFLLSVSEGYAESYVLPPLLVGSGHRALAYLR